MQALKADCLKGRNEVFVSWLYAWPCGVFCLPVRPNITGRKASEPTSFEQADTRNLEEEISTTSREQNFQHFGRVQNAL